LEDIIVDNLGLVWAVMVVEECAIATTTAWRGEECPNCGSEDTYLAYYNCPYHHGECGMFYCCNCYILWEYKLVGEEPEREK